MDFLSKLIKYFTEKQEGWFQKLIVFITIIGLFLFLSNDRNITKVSVNNININGNVTINYCKE